jgi:serine/threonine-protein kinase
MKLQPGDRLADYEVICPLGAGGMGDVYKVGNLITRRFEAIKVLLPELVRQEGAAERFIREIQILAALDHPNITRLNTAQVWNGQLLMVMEFVDGVTLCDKLKGPPIPIEQGVGYVLQTLEALAYAHGQPEPVIHRDIKPANLMITRDERVKLMDFGIAKVEGARDLTKTGTTIGSVCYMPPERLLGKGGQIDGRSDIYSLGIVLYEVLAGRRPFDSDSDYSIMEAHVKSEPVSPSSINPGISVELNRVVLKALAKDPAHRFQTANEFLSALTYAASPRSVAETPVSRIEEPSAAKMAQPKGPAQEPLIPSRAASSHRSLYMLLGSGLAVGAMVLLGVFVPIFLKAHAGNRTTEPKPEIKDPVIQVAPANPPATSTTATPASLTTPPGGDAAPLTSTTGSATNPSTDTSVPPTNRKSDTRAPRGSNKNGSTVAQVSNKSELPVGAQPPNSPNRAAIADAQNRLDALRPRVDAMNSYWNTMRAQQQKEGLDLRTSLVQELSAMNQSLKESESSLKSGEVDSANRAMTRMEENLKLLEATAAGK